MLVRGDNIKKDQYETNSLFLGNPYDTFCLFAAVFAILQVQLTRFLSAIYIQLRNILLFIHVNIYDCNYIITSFLTCVSSHTLAAYGQMCGVVHMCYGHCRLLTPYVQLSMRLYIEASAKFYLLTFKNVYRCKYAIKIVCLYQYATKHVV